jgi:hypothetical protein
MFWKTRLEPSIATDLNGVGDADRTLVSYKETLADAKIDPEPGVWTGTWRDARFGPHDGGRPENALTGQLFEVNGDANSTTNITVPAELGRMRFWRDTTVANLVDGQEATLAFGTLGYEWDVDAAAFRPTGSFPVSRTTVPDVQVLQNEGSVFATGTATHAMTLYRSSSGALVFGAGTIQWSWGLDANHDRGSGLPADVRIQQATANLFADMGAGPATIATGLVHPTASTDVTAPSSSVTEPVTGASLQRGAASLIKGTASDADGQVAAVDVSVDNGVTWRRASGRGSWSLAYTPTATGQVQLRTRAVDDSGNIETPGPALSLAVEGRQCPCTIWGDVATPTADDIVDPTPVELGVKWVADIDGRVTGLRFYKGPGNTGTHVGRLWTAAGVELAQATFTSETAGGWQQVHLSSPVAITQGTTYVVSYHVPEGHYSADSQYFNSAFGSSPLTALSDSAGGNGVYGYGPEGTFPTDSYRQSNYWVDVVFEATDARAPRVSAISPLDGTADTILDVSPSATFDEALDPASVSSDTAKLIDVDGAEVPSTVTYDAAARRVTVNPDVDLGEDVQYTVRIVGGNGGITDAAGNALAADREWSFRTLRLPPGPDDGRGGPILVVTRNANPYTRYLAEILRAQGLNEFATADVSKITPALLADFKVVLLGETPLTATQASLFTDWVTAGGDLISMKPDQRLNGLLGVTPRNLQVANGYIAINGSSASGSGLPTTPLQFHGSAERYTAAAGTRVAATLYSDSSTSTGDPAVLVRDVGTAGGSAVTFAFDLAQSVIQTRQGNPLWAGDERDGNWPIRSNELFFGAKATDMKPDWIDLSRIAIPQADEQQRLLARLIGEVVSEDMPLPQLWFLPRGEKAAVVMTGDDHGSPGSTINRFDKYQAASPPGCSVELWQCIRSTSYIYTQPLNITDDTLAAYKAQGFDIALHLNTGCTDFTEESIAADLTAQITEFRNAYPRATPPATNRTHCVVWSDWASEPRQLAYHGMRMDTSYYHWPSSWLGNLPGFLTGSGMPMRFTDESGAMIDVYQAPTQMTDESGQSYPGTVNTLLDNALGANQYFGIFTANMHTDVIPSPESDAIIAAAKARGVPVISAQQLLTWLDGRNDSAFENLAFAGGRLTFHMSVGTGATGLRFLLPMARGIDDLTRVERDGAPVSFTTRTVKGVQYALVPASEGDYVATYEHDTVAPVISAVAEAPRYDGTANITWTTDEPSDTKVVWGTAPGALTQSATAAALVTAHAIRITGLTPGTVYWYQVQSKDAKANLATGPAVARSFRVPVPRSPRATSIDTGTLRAGTFARLATDDNLFYDVNAAVNGTGRLAAWYALVDGIPANPSSLEVTYSGSNSRSATQSLQIRKFSGAGAGTWVNLDTRTVGTGEVVIADKTPTGTLSEFVSGAGEVWVRVTSSATGSSTFYARGDLVRVVYRTP